MTVPRLIALLVACLALGACGGDAPAPAPEPGDTGSAARTAPAPAEDDAPGDEQAGDDEPAGEDPAGEQRGRGDPRLPFRRLPGVTTAGARGPFGEEGLDRWREVVPEARDIRIRSSADGHRQPALWLPPSGRGARPLLVVLHSWSNSYHQHVGIPLARWARRHGWAMIAPNFRGRNDSPEATGSRLAVRDVLDAVDHATRRAKVDGERVFLIGFSGGGMMSLTMAGRHPRRFAGAAAWVPVYDLVDWHAYNASRGVRYAGDIAVSCGGDPRYDRSARRECRRRSVSRRLHRAREAGVPVYIAHGIADTLVPPDHAVRAFNVLAARRDRLGPGAIDAISVNRLPSRLRGRIDARTHFGAGDPRVVFARRSREATLVLFQGEHDMVYHPALRWMARDAVRR